MCERKREIVKRGRKKEQGKEKRKKKQGDRKQKERKKETVRGKKKKKRERVAVRDWSKSSPLHTVLMKRVNLSVGFVSERVPAPRCASPHRFPPCTPAS